MKELSYTSLLTSLLLALPLTSLCAGQSSASLVSTTPSRAPPAASTRPPTAPDLSDPSIPLNQLVNENAVPAPPPPRNASNGTEVAAGASTPATAKAAPPEKAKENKTLDAADILPEAGAAEEEHLNSMSIFFVLAILALCILMIHYMIGSKLRYLPESVAVVFLGALIGLVLLILSKSGVADWQREEAFSPTVFFLVLLPPIIFESGYNLHKGNFFQNFGSIMVFAVFGTLISALVVGGGVYLLGLADVAYHLSFVESFAFGSLISAVDPVATLAIFNALDVDPVLNMLVFGESILNDAVAIVLTTTVLESDSPAMAHMSSSEALLHGVGRFCFMFVASAALGAVSALLAALLFKHVDLRNNPSLEFAMMLIFTYAPYGLAEGVHLSGIMAILFCGIVMSQYTHYNLSPVTQITMQQTMRTLAFVAETCVFAYLGMAIFSFGHQVEPALVIWSLMLCLFGRALNIFPLSALVNYFREHKITKKMQAIMWFSGLRGAIAYALCLHLEFGTEKRHVLVTTTLIVVLSSILLLGGATQPLLKYLSADRFSDDLRTRRRRRSRRQRDLNLSKTHELGAAIDSEHLSELTEDERDTNSNPTQLRGFAKWDYLYFKPFFTRRLTQQELREAKTQMTDLANKVYETIRVTPAESDDEQELLA
ncbi:sodium/hydrogen exchanger 8-like [Pollicipes pollicipes]|uniref:sodium/hydrogen exchanger 8-like n=1 Tax=Pollicipes pollicipes TaxID=41117 RepID=UPI0018851F1B|nr:sodium/hydrogen exchanger 8-like [Pollicipes pollicipes]